MKQIVWMILSCWTLVASARSIRVLEPDLAPANESEWIEAIDAEADAEATVANEGSELEPEAEVNEGSELEPEAEVNDTCCGEAEPEV
ncbi:MAG: hypothetical protein ISP86_02275 [Shewanellaceae bacterium]|nr:hypothetical protein [Shewanellaceae bacterium]